MELIDAKKLAIDLAIPPGIEWVRLEDGLGRVLAEAIVADRGLPEECRSRLDGFAIRSIDTRGASPDTPISLNMKPGLMAAGHPATQKLEPGESIRILTGAPVPAGADAVAPQEEALRTNGALVLKRSFLQGGGVALPGEEIKQGELLLSSGEILTPTRLALIAALGHARIPVYIRPRVALLATGDELRDLDGTGEGQQTFCNNRYLLSWLVRIQGGDPIHLGVVGDDVRAIASALSKTDADFVISTGGMGKGDRDFILDAWGMIGVMLRFRDVNLSPGKNSALGTLERSFFWGLPGNPWGAQVVFEELIAPALRRFQGVNVSEGPWIKARLETSIEKKRGIHKAVRGGLNLGEDFPSFAPTRNKAASTFAGLRDSFAYVLLDSHVTRVEEGSEVKVHLHDFPLLASPLFRTGGLCRG